MIILLEQVLKRYLESDNFGNYFLIY